MKNINPKCIPIDYLTIVNLGYQVIPICNYSMSYDGTFYQELQNSAYACPKTCNSYMFKGDLVEGSGYFDDPRHTEIYFWFASNETQIHQEYLVFDTIGLIGSIGGNLGLFIGFSFHEALVKLISSFKNLLLRLSTNMYVK